MQSRITKGAVYLSISVLCGTILVYFGILDYHDQEEETRCSTFNEWKLLYYLTWFPVGFFLLLDTKYETGRQTNVTLVWLSCLQEWVLTVLLIAIGASLMPYYNEITSICESGANGWKWVNALAFWGSLLYYFAHWISIVFHAFLQWQLHFPFYVCETAKSTSPNKNHKNQHGVLSKGMQNTTLLSNPTIPDSTSHAVGVGVTAPPRVCERRSGRGHAHSYHAADHSSQNPQNPQNAANQWTVQSAQKDGCQVQETKNCEKVGTDNMTAHSLSPNISIRSQHEYKDTFSDEKVPIVRKDESVAVWIASDPHEKKYKLSTSNHSKVGMGFSADDSLLDSNRSRSQNGHADPYSKEEQLVECSCRRWKPVALQDCDCSDNNNRCLCSNGNDDLFAHIDENSYGHHIPLTPPFGLLPYLERGFSVGVDATSSF